MALPKVLTAIWEKVQFIGEMRDTINRIEAKLDAALAAPVSSTLEERGYLWTSTPAPEPQKLDPAAVAEALAYDTYSAREIFERVESLTPEERAALVEYETAHKNRTTVLEALKAPVVAPDVETQLEAETGHDFTQTGDDPPTYVETDAPAPGKEK